jgi:hypothetical protein
MESVKMITCVGDYIINPRKIDAFEKFARRWINLVNRHGGQHHGYFLPSEGATDRALALFSFPNLAEYERYRSRFGVDKEFIDADRITRRISVLSAPPPSEESRGRSRRSAHSRPQVQRREAHDLFGPPLMHPGRNVARTMKHAPRQTSMQPFVST